MKVTEVKVGQVWKNYKTKVEKSVASVTEDEAMMDDMKYIPIKTLLAGKSWKCISDDAVAHEKESTEEVAGDGTPYSEVMEEIVADEQSLVDHYTKKPKKEKKASKKAPVEKAEKADKKDKPKKEKVSRVSVDEKMAKVAEIAQLIQDTGNLAKIFEKKCMVSIVKDKKSMAEFYVRNGKIAIWCKKEVADNYTEHYAVKHHPTCGMKYQFDVPNMDAVVDIINFIKEEK